MKFLNSVLRKLINRQYDFCCLCYKTIDTSPIYLEDDVIMIENGFDCNVKLSEILTCLFGEEMYKNMSMFEAVCEQCSVKAINSYKFVIEVKDTVKYVTDAIEHVTACCEGKAENENSETLFMSLNPDLHSSKLIYDNVLLKNAKEGLERFKKIVEVKNEKTETKVKKDPENHRTIRKRIGYKERYKSMISIIDILHDKNDPTNLKCKECLKNFSSSGNLRNHFIRVHSPKTYKCHKCQRRFGSKAILLAHQEGSHVSLVCSDCGKRFNNKHTLRIHEKSHYLKLICQACGRVYKNHNTFKKHLENEICQRATRRSQVDAKYTCDYCNKKYTQKMTLRVHIQYEHLNYKYLECKWCTKKFWCQSRLNAHSVKHTKERNFMCDICNGKFVTRESLLYHTRIHTGEKPYQCPHCESRFLSASRRSAHVKSHHMDPTVECGICHSKFRSHHYLQKHKKIHSLQENKIKSEEPETHSEELVVSKLSKRYTYPNLLKSKQLKPTSDTTKEIASNLVPKRELVLDDLEGNCIKYYVQIDPNSKGVGQTLNSNDDNEIVAVCTDPYVYETNCAVNQNAGEKVYLEVTDGETKYIIQS